MGNYTLPTLDPCTPCVTNYARQYCKTKASTGTITPSVLPTTGISGIPLVVQPILQLLDSNGLPALLYAGNVTATVTAGPGTIVSGGVVVAVAGLAVYLLLTISGIGVSTVTVSAPGFASFSFDVNITLV